VNPLEKQLLFVVSRTHLLLTMNPLGSSTRPAASAASEENHDITRPATTPGQREN